MDLKTARKLFEKYKKEVCWDHDHTNEDALLEITEYLAEQTQDPWYTGDLGGYYYGERKFDLALKYYEKTYELGDRRIAVCLGYIWYYGRTGTVDYEKAYAYFKEAADLGDSEAARKLADMYKNGYFVEKDYGKYCRIIEALYAEYQDEQYPYQSLPDLCTRLAGIRKKEGKIEEAVSLYRDAKGMMAARLRVSGFFGDVNIMEWLINDLYELVPPDYADLDLYDLFYVLKEPVTVTFFRHRKKYQIRSSFEDGEYAVEFQGRCYRSVNELIQKALLGGKPLYVQYQDIYNVEVCR